MAKWQLSAKIDVRLYNVIIEIARKFFDGNKTRALEWMLMSQFKPAQFARFMAKHHAMQLNLYKDMYEVTKVENPDKEVIQC